MLIVSPHWMTREVRVTTSLRPPTIHDFGGFDPALYDITYPATGHPALALSALERLRAAGWLTSPMPTAALIMVPGCHCATFIRMPTYPCFRSRCRFDSTQRQRGPWAGRRAAGRRGVLIVGSGSLTHNLYELRADHAHVEDYAAEFASWIRDAVERGEPERLKLALELAPHARRAHPTSEHFLPLLVAAGAAAAPCLPP